MTCQPVGGCWAVIWLLTLYTCEVAPIHVGLRLRHSLELVRLAMASPGQDGILIGPPGMQPVKPVPGEMAAEIQEC